MAALSTEVSEQELDDLYEKVLQAYTIDVPFFESEPEDDPSRLADHTPSEPPSIAVDTHYGASIQRSSSLTPSVVSTSSNATQSPSSSTVRRRPLPPTPGGSSTPAVPPVLPTASSSSSSSSHARPALAPSAPNSSFSTPVAAAIPLPYVEPRSPNGAYPDPTSRGHNGATSPEPGPGPSTSSSSATRMERRRTRKGPPDGYYNPPVVVAPEVPEGSFDDPNALGGWNDDPNQRLPSPTTEYHDQYENLPLPSYQPNAVEGERLLDYAPLPGQPVHRDYQDDRSQTPPAMLDTRDSAASTPITHITALYGAMSSAEGGTFMSVNDYQLLRPPSGPVDTRHTFDTLYEEPPRSLHNSEDTTIQNTRTAVYDEDYFPPDDWEVGPSTRRPITNVIQEIVNFVPHPLGLHGLDDVDSIDEEEKRYINPCLLSHLAVQLRDHVPRGTHVKRSIPYPRAFTGKDIVSTLHTIIHRELVRDIAYPPSDRRASLLVARSLQTMLFFYEVEWESRLLQDGVEDVYMFMDDQEGPSDGPIERNELPTGVITVLTKCYAASCDDVGPCYAYSCPKRGRHQLPDPIELAQQATKRQEWIDTVSPHILASLPQREISRQTVIHQLIAREEMYIQDLDIVETIFIKGLRHANPPVMTPLILNEFIEEVFGNILELRDTNRRLLEVMRVRHREQYPIIESIGDIFLDAATEFRSVYPTYVGKHPLAEKRLKEEVENNPELRLFLEKCSRQLAANAGGEGARFDFNLKHYLNRPAEHLQKYPVVLDAAYQETEPSNPEREYIVEAIAAIQNLQNVAQLRTFQSAMGKGIAGRWDWHDLVSPEMMDGFTPEERKRQSTIFELIKGEMSYVRDLENIETMYIRPLRNAEPHIIPPDRLDQFLADVFHNWQDLHAHHRRLVDTLHEIQREEHPRIRTITAAVFDAALNFREAYMEYIPNYPIAAYRIDDEMANNPEFRNFAAHAVRHPDAHRLDMKNFINRPIPRLLRYELLLKQILTETPPWHEDRTAIPQVIDVIKALGKETEPGVASAKQKVELWKYNSNLVFKEGEYVDMDLLNEHRSLLYTGKLLRPPEGGLDYNWTELFCLLFDNYFVMTKPREKDGVTKYHVFKRPIPLDLLSLVNFNDPSILRSQSLLRTFRNNNATTTNLNQSSDAASIHSRADSSNDSRAVYPCTIHHNGRLAGPCLLYAESAAIRAEWKSKLEEALGLRKVVQESNKVFEIESLSVDTFIVPSMHTGPGSPVWHDGTFLTGRVTCSVPFNTADGRGLVAIGCAEGVWIGYRHDSRSLRRVLHLKMVTQCAMLEDFGLFLVLADKVLYAYHIEALVPTTPGSIHASQAPQKINGRDVQFFTTGVFHGRTLVIYMKKKHGNEVSIHAVEPVIDKIQEPRKPPTGNIFRRKQSEWFRNFKDFVLPDAYDLVFLRARLVILCSKGFMIMDLADPNCAHVMIPQKDDPRYNYLPKRCDACRPLGMFKTSDAEFLLCYDEFGLFVDKHGNPSRTTGIIEWEGKADRVAMHAPYIMLFDTRFIEIRQIENGRLVQIIPGNDVRCVWDGRNAEGATTTAPADTNDENMIQEPRVHAVMNMAEPTAQPGRPMRGIVQHVFELYPTIPLYLPGSLASPTTVPYFPMSYSPPRSPPLRSHHI